MPGNTVTRAVVLTLPRQSERQKPFAAWRLKFPLGPDVPAPVFRYGIDGPTHEIGVAQSHANALYEFAAEPGDPSDWLLVLEDDARWGSEFARAWPQIRDAVPAGADLVFLGGAHKPTGETEPITDRLAWARGIYRMHCYLVRRSSAYKAARIMTARPEHCDVLVSDASESGELAVCAARPFLVAQKPGTGWYAWNAGEGGVNTEAGLELYCRHALGVPAAEQKHVILYGHDATASRARAVAGKARHVLGIADGDVAVLADGPAPEVRAPAPAKPCAGCGDKKKASNRAVAIQPPPLGLKPTRPRAVVTAVVGRDAEAMHAITGPHLRAYAERVGADLVVLRWPGTFNHPVTCKFQLARVLDHYERAAFVDADTAIDPLKTVNLFDQCAEGEFGFCDEWEWQTKVPGFDRHAQYQQFRCDLGFRCLDTIPWYMNSGVMVVSRAHRELLLPPTRGILNHHCSEQDWISASLLDSGLPYKILDRKCNWQWWTDPGFKAAPADAILHWSGSGPNEGRVHMIAEWAARCPLPHRQPRATP